MAAPELLPSDPQLTAPIYSAKPQTGSVDLTRAGLAGSTEADVILERAVALASGLEMLGMRLCALELCSVLLFVTKPLRYLALTCGEGCTPDRKVHSEVI